jgi:hypothetical protein
LYNKYIGVNHMSGCANVHYWNYRGQINNHVVIGFA